VVSRGDELSLSILMLSPHAGVSGPLPKHTPLLVEALRKLGCDVGEEPWGRHSDSERAVAKVLGRVNDIRRIRRRLVRDPVDVLVVKTSHEWKSLARDLPLLAAVRRHVRTIVVQFHGSRSDLLVGPGNRPLKEATSRLLRLADGVLVLSSEEQAELERFLPGARVHVVSNPFVPAPRLLTMPAHRARPRRLSMLYVGRLIPEKGAFDALEALPLLRGNHECELVVVGDGPSRETLEARAEELDLGDAVRFPGYLRGDELLDEYERAHLFVFPTYWIEGFPTVVAEAMAAGLPIITTRTRGIIDHLAERTNALFVPPRDPTAIASAADTLLAHGPLRQAMEAANREAVAAFAPTPVAEHYLKALQQCQDGRRNT
jgi:glycosyltransferase involved in cell wall biosynthesis